jgi:PAS domain S-box-containing protein
MKRAEALAGAQAPAGFGLFDTAQQRLVSLIESAHDAIISKDLNGIIISWNRGAERLFGYSAEEIVGRPITVLIPEDRLEEEPKILARIRSGDRIEHFDTVRRRKDGSLIDISLTVSPLLDADGRIIGASKIARDVTDRKRATEALARHIEEQAALYQFTDRLHRAESLGDVYQAALDAIIRALRCERASILLFDAAGVMRFVAWRGLSEDYRRAVDGHSPWTADAEDPQPITIDDVDRADLPDALRQIITAEGIGALAFIPLVASGRLVGKFMTYYAAPHTFTRSEMELAFTLARQLGFGVERLRAEEARRVAEQSLRESEARFRSMANITPAIIWTADRTGAITFHNQRWLDYTGLTAEENSRDWAERVLHPDDLERCVSAWNRALEQGTDYEIEVRNRRHDGAYRWFLTRATPIRDAGGRIIEWYGSTTDIHDRKQAEAALQESEQRLQFALEAGRMGAWAWDIASGNVVWSPSLQEIHGLKPGTFGGTFADFKRDIHPDDLERILAAVGHAVETASDYHVTYRMRHPVGGIRWLEAFGRCVPGPDGKPIELAGVCTDISERKQAEEALLRSERRFRTLTSQAPVGIFETDPEGNCLFVNEKWCELAGMPMQAALGKGWANALYAEDRERVFQEWYAAATEAKEFSSEYRFRTPDDRISWLEGSAQAVRDIGGRVTGYIGSIMDITERKRAEAQRELLVAELSHRVKNTLAIVISIARQSFSKTRNNEDAHASFEARIRALAQTHSRLAEANWSGVSLQTIVLDEVAPYRREDGANVRISGPSVSLSPKSAVTLGMALHELATNAAKYGALSGKEGSVEVSWELDAPACELRISWSEQGGPAVAPPVGSGFGRLLLERALASDLAGRVSLDFARDGLNCLIAIPLDDHVVHHA